MEDKPEVSKAPPEPKFRRIDRKAHSKDSSDVIRSAQESTDDRLVEAAAKKDGLRGALAAKMDSMSREAKQWADTWNVNNPRAKWSHPSELPRVIIIGTGAMMYFIPAKSVELASAFMRDRLQPKAVEDRANEPQSISK